MTHSGEKSLPAKGRQRSISVASALGRSLSGVWPGSEMLVGFTNRPEYELGVPNPPVLRLEEPRQERVHLQQSLAREPDLVAGHRGEAFLDERIEPLAELAGDLRAELPAEVAGVELA